jgi:hypothetical protein
VASPEQTVSVNFDWLYFKTKHFKALADRVGLAEQRKLRIYMRPIVRGNVRRQANILINRDGGRVSVEFKSGHNGEYEMKRRSQRGHMDLKCPCIDTTMQLRSVKAHFMPLSEYSLSWRLVSYWYVLGLFESATWMRVFAEPGPLSLP